MQCEIARQFFEMLHVITAEQKIPREYCGEHVLYRAEIELLNKIDENPAANVSTLSGKCGVTRSAVTQMSARLLEKGLVERYQSMSNKKEKYFRLTNMGRRVREEHDEYNKIAADKLRHYLCSLGENDKRAIVLFMEMMKQYVPLCSFPCGCAWKDTACFLAAKGKEIEQSC